MDAVSASAAASQSLDAPTPTTPKTTSSGRRTSPLALSAQHTGSANSPESLNAVFETPSPAVENVGGRSSSVAGGGGAGRVHMAAPGPRSPIIHKSKRAREMRRAKCRQRSADTAEPTAEEVEALQVMIERRLSSASTELDDEEYVPTQPRLAESTVQ